MSRSIVTDCVVKENAQGLVKEVWQFSFTPTTFRLTIDSYHNFVRKSKDEDYHCRVSWSASGSRTGINTFDKDLIPFGSGLWAAAIESVLLKLQIDKIIAPDEAKELAINEFKKHIKMAN